MENLKIIIVTQARVGSSRFPEKVLKSIAETTMLGMHLERLNRSKRANKIIVATTFEEKSIEIISIAENCGAAAFQGSTNDVLDRFYQAVLQDNPDIVVRVTSDCPLIDASIIDNVVDLLIKNNLDYASNILIESFPDGQDVEVFTFKALETAWKQAILPSEREHVTPYIRKNCDFNDGKIFKAQNLDAPKNYNAIRMTVDEPNDLITVKILVENLGSDKRWLDYAKFIEVNVNSLTNQEITRNEGYKKSLIQDTNE